MTHRRAFLAACPLAALLLLSPGAARGETSKTMVLAATIFPAADIVHRVAGPDVRVLQVLPAGASPHTFDLTPKQVRQLQDVRLVFKIGGIDDWIDGVADSLPRDAIIALHKDIARLPFHHDGHGHDHGSTHRDEEFDPHYWLSAANGAIMARTIAGALSAYDPAHAAVYEANCQAYVRELTKLHADLKSTMGGLDNNKMIVFHDGWRYFAAAYNLEIAAVFQPSPGREPTPRNLQKLYEVARRSGARVVFSEPQLPSSSIEPLLHDLGLKLVVLDPLGGIEPSDSYASLLQRNAHSILQALGR